MSSNIIGHKIIFKNKVNSTNQWIKDNIPVKTGKGGVLVWADEQSHGRGQGVNTWESEKGKNLTFSFILLPKILEVQNQFYISKFVSVAICKFFSHFTDFVKIKWPNDIYINDKKIAGILIENIISGKYINESIVGVGVNINQDLFLDSLPNPISLKQITNSLFKLEDILKDLCDELNFYFDMLENENYETLDILYHKLMYKLNKKVEFYKNDKIIKAEIKGVDEIGCLVLEFDNKVEVFQHHEVKMIVE